MTQQCDRLMATRGTRGQGLRQASKPMRLSPHASTGEGMRGCKEALLDAAHVGGALVVVRAGESPVHGEGEQFEWLVGRVTDLKR